MQNLALHAAFKLSFILEVLLRHKLVTAEVANSVTAFIKANQTFNPAAPYAAQPAAAPSPAAMPARHGPAVHIAALTPYRSFPFWGLDMRQPRQVLTGCGHTDNSVVKVCLGYILCSRALGAITASDIPCTFLNKLRSVVECCCSCRVSLPRECAQPSIAHCVAEIEKNVKRSLFVRIEGFTNVPSHEEFASALELLCASCTVELLNSVQSERSICGRCEGAGFLSETIEGPSCVWV